MILNGVIIQHVLIVSHGHRIHHCLHLVV
ncbi:hypothetical protein BLA29_013295 [Euroglyphus maynei]|uniref:Uncharacterized protein n=1 Tax=Euroglyphus maynei TaxID=6958 RepID=A0A1Y3AUG3_EURMA|nr:hypothetical protein BLA29_013295 [Euroglyphus maynei]